MVLHDYLEVQREVHLEEEIATLQINQAANWATKEENATSYKRSHIDDFNLLD